MDHGQRNAGAEPIMAGAVGLERLTTADRDRAGAKAANLGAMIRAGLPVPGGFCVLAAAFRAWIESDAGLRTVIARVEGGGTGALEAARDLRERLGGMPLPEAVRRTITEACERRGAACAWAVRSSASAEDGAQGSFAGQHDTWLNIRGAAAVAEAVRRCWVSLFTDRAVIYRSQGGTPPAGPAMAVIVQEMVNAEVSGVLFTCDPVGGEADRMVIEATYGLGEGLVGGKISPDRIELDKATLDVRRRTVSRKAVEVVGGEAGGVRERMVPEARQLAPCLSDGTARRLGVLATEAERLFGGPQDIEWAACGDRLFLLQARPVAARGVRRRDPPAGTVWAGAAAAVVGPETDVWTNANAVEAMPEVVTPLAWSALEVLLDEFLYPVMRRMGLDPDSPPLVGRIAGRAYLNLRCVHALVDRLSPSVYADVARAFGGEFASLAIAMPAAGSARSAASRIARWRRAVRTGLWLVPGLIGQRRLIERWAQRSLGGPALTPAASLPDAELARHPIELLRRAAHGEGERTLAAAAWMGLSGVGGATALFRLTRRWLGDADGSVANRLLAGARGMNSAENGLELARLAAWVRARPALHAALRGTAGGAELETRLAGLGDGAEFLRRWATFLERHGHQARGGMDPAQPRWAEQPGFVLDMLRVYLGFDADSDPLVVRESRLRERERLLSDCLRRLGDPFRRGVLKAVIWASQRGLVQRENVKNEGVRLVAAIRRAVLEAGRRLVLRGVLPAREDVFFLRLEELEPVLCSRPGFNVAAVIGERKAAHARDGALEPPPLIVGKWDPALKPAEPTGPVQGGVGCVLHGVAVSPGVVTGPARVIRQCDGGERLRAGEILVAPYTDPGWTPYFLAAAGVVVDVGGQLSHGSVVAREYGLPAVVNVRTATTLIKTGQRIRVDGTCGVVTVVG